jgi:acyl-CoA synthetase (AMP-forming)/AMP-acid ligase II
MPNLAVGLAEPLTGSQSVLVADGRVTRARDLGERLLGLAAWLLERGVAPADRAVVLAPPGPDLVAAVLALQWVGAVPVLADPDLPEEVFQAQVGLAEPRWVVADGRLARAWRIPLLPGALARAGRPLPPRPGRGEVLPIPGAARGGPPAVPRDAHDEALVVFTAGTTSRPRGVVHTHGSLAAFLGNVRVAVGGLGFASYVAETPPQLFYGLALGAVCHVAGGRGEGRVRRLWRLMEAGAAEAWFGGPWLWTRWLREGRVPPAGLRALVLGSAPVTAAFLRTLLAVAPAELRVLCLYGLTEAGPVATVDGREKAAWDGEGDLAGRVVPGLQVAVVDGEVRVAGDAVAPRYLGGPATGPWLATGDLGRLGPDSLVLLGRSKDMIVRRGRNIYPGLFEPLLARSLADPALVGVFDARSQDERVVLAFTGRQPDALPLLGEAAPDHLLPLEALPRRGRQRKVDREALRRIARERFAIPG